MDPKGYSEEKMIGFLQSSENYLHKPSSIKIVQTHASILAIAPPFVYKVKKHVDLGFLNFMSLEERKVNAEREVELNSRLCKDLYLEIIPIFLADGTYSFVKGDKIIDYALKMNELEDGYFFNQLVQNNQVDTSLLDKVICILSNFYSSQGSNPQVNPYGGIDQIKESTAGNFNYLKKIPNTFINQQHLALIEQYTSSFYKKEKRLFLSRILENKIRDCHGDLHLEHIHCKDDRICIYDCIEFNEKFRFIDVTSDIAFLAMDLDFHERPDLSYYLVNKLSSELKDAGILKLMDFYKCYRACVRAKVELIKYQQSEVSEDERANSLKKGRKFLHLALKYAIIGSAPFVIFVGGRVGTGKSTLALRISEALGISYVSSDVVRKRSVQIPLHERTKSEEKKHVYSQTTTNKVYASLLNTLVDAANSRKSIVADATFGTSDIRKVFFKELDKRKINFVFIEATASDEVIKHRLSGRDNELNVVSDARLEDFEMLNAKYEPPKEVQAEKYLAVDTQFPVHDGEGAILDFLLKGKT